MDARLRAASIAITRAKGLLQEHRDAIPDVSARQLECYFADVDELIESMTAGNLPTTEDLVAAVVTSCSTVETLWTAILALDDRLSIVEQELQQERATKATILEELKLVQSQLMDFVADHEKLVLREVSAQMANKLARRSLPGLTQPFAARYTTLVRITTDKKRDQIYLNSVFDRYPHLEAGIAALNELAIPVAHPGQMKQLGALEDVTYDALATLAGSHFLGSHELGSVNEVLSCLLQLSVELKEDLFVNTHKP